MKSVLPIVIICCVGIALCIGYLVFLFVKCCVKPKGKKVECFEIDENTLTIYLDEKATTKNKYKSE